MVKCTIAPWLSVRRSAKAVEFYKSACGATQAFRIDSPDGGVVARLSVDGAEFWVGDESPEHQNLVRDLRWGLGADGFDGCGPGCDVCASGNGWRESGT
jgi:uncharacterized glyoxalase superfamily protein PhnB